MIRDNLTQKIQDATKQGDAIRVSTLKLLANALHNEWIAKQRELTDEEELAIVRRQIKQREEAVELYKKGGREELADKEEKELGILKDYLPAQMGEEEIVNLVNQVINETGAKGMQDFGKVMGEVMKKVAGKADGKIVAQIVKKKLN